MKEFYSITTKCLKAIADPKRLRIIDMLSNHERCASDILEEFQVTNSVPRHEDSV